MLGKDTLRADLKNLKHSAIVYDIVYNPLKTELLKSAEIRGNQIVTGIGMLVEQALVGFEEWFGKRPEPSEDLMK